MVLSDDLDGMEKRNHLSNKNETYLPNSNNSTIMNVPLTSSHFLDAYSKGKWNLSKVPCPPCFDGVEMLVAPDHYNEPNRLIAVNKFKNSEQWKNREVFSRLLAKALKFLNVSGAAISLVDGRRQIVKYQISLNINECPKKVSIDAHTILSSNSFILTDASKDWRTANNPLVKGAPFIKFYAGVPLVTRFGAVIGVFSVFDAFPRHEFNKKNVKYLQQLAEEVINILGSPPNRNEINPNTNLPLIKIIGRATSQGSQFSPIAVYEKDGSGSQYSQNINFRYSKLDYKTESSQILIDEEIVKKLSFFRDVKLASSQLCKIVKEKSGFDLCCIVEIRVSQSYQIPSEFFPQENVIDAESFKFANELIKINDENIMSRVLGSYGYEKGNFNFNSDLFHSSLTSEFGIFYEKTNNSDVKFQAGLLMPFYRLNSKLMRKRKIIKSNKSNKSEKPLEVYLRSGGFLIVALNEKERPISDEEINLTYVAACSLRRIFITN